MWEDLKTNRAVQALLCFIACLLVGLGTVKYLAPQRWAAATMGGASVTGIALAWLIARKPSTQTANSPEAASSESVSQLEQPENSAPAWFEKTAGNERYLVANLRTTDQQNIDDTLVGFLGSMERESQLDASQESHCWLERQPGDSLHSEAGYWFLKESAASVLAAFVEVVVVVGPDSKSQRPVISGLLRSLRWRASRPLELAQSIYRGRVPEQPQFKGVVLCCPIKGLISSADSVASTAIREMRALGLDLQSRFPLYLVITGLESVSGFSDFAEGLLAAFGPPALDQTLGIAVTDSLRSKESLANRLNDVVRRLCGLRLSVLRVQQQVLDRQLDRVNEEHLRRGLEIEAHKRLARTYEFPRQIGIYVDVVAEFCWKLLARSTGPAEGPFLRGIFYSGILLSTAEPAPGTVHRQAMHGRRVFGWNLLTEHLTEISRDLEK